MLFHQAQYEKLILRVLNPHLQARWVSESPKEARVRTFSGKADHHIFAWSRSTRLKYILFYYYGISFYHTLYHPKTQFEFVVGLWTAI